MDMWYVWRVILRTNRKKAGENGPFQWIPTWSVFPCIWLMILALQVPEHKTCIKARSDSKNICLFSFPFYVLVYSRIRVWPWVAMIWIHKRFFFIPCGKKKPFFLLLLKLHAHRKFFLRIPCATQKQLLFFFACLKNGLTVWPRSHSVQMARTKNAFFPLFSRRRKRRPK